MSKRKALAVALLIMLGCMACLSWVMIGERREGGGMDWELLAFVPDLGTFLSPEHSYFDTSISQYNPHAQSSPWYQVSRQLAGYGHLR
jgi:hypothetical protein